MKKLLSLSAIAGTLLMVTLSATTVHAGMPELLDQAHGGVIVGNRDGAYDAYALEHPGGGRSITVRMNFGPWHPNNEGGIGFNLYPEGGKPAVQGLKPDAHATQLAITLTDDFPTNYLVQVHNYYHGFWMNYVLDVEGLVQAKAAVKAPVEGGTAKKPAPLAGLGRGTVPGQSHGSFDCFEFYHPGGKAVWIKMIYQPDHWIIAHGVGFNVYHGHDLIAHAEPLGLDWHTRWVKLEPAMPATYFIQVYNYIPEITLSYQIAVTEQAIAP